MKFEDLKVGQKVRIRSDLITDKAYGHDNVHMDMLKYRGQIVTIDRLQDFVRKFYIEEDYRKWSWTPEMIEPTSKRIKII